MKARLISILVSALIFLIAGCGEDSGELLRGEFPYAAITSPAHLSEVFGVIKIAVDAMDNSAISVIELFIDGEATEVLATDPYEYDWDTTELDDGSMHTIYAKVVDDEGYTMGTHVINVTTRNAGVTGNTYTNWKYGFRISAPSPEWTISTGDSLFGIELPFLVGISSGLPGASTAIVTAGAEAFSSDPSRYQQLMETQFRDMKIGVTKDTTVNGIPAKELRLRIEQFLAPTMRAKLIYFVKGKVAYSFIGLAEESAYSLYEEELDEIIDTIEFL